MLDLVGAGLIPAPPLDANGREVRLGETVLPYDYLVLALGSQTGYFAHPEWETVAPGLKSLDDALRMATAG